MTIIQAKPLKQFGISGPASALDNEVPVFDGITGKKIKAATGIICPSSGRLDLAEIRAKDGNGLKLYEDGGAGIFVKDGGNVGIGTTAPENKIHVVDSKVTGTFERSTALTNLTRTVLNLKHTTSGNMADGFGPVFNFAIEDSAGVNNYIAHFGAVMDGADNSGKLVFGTRNAGANDQSQYMVIDKTGNFGIGTTVPGAKLDIDSDIIRLRTAKTPASAGAAGNQGDECWDADYHYRCVATNTWKRTALTTW